jgi:hypothetical protein
MVGSTVAIISDQLCLGKVERSYGDGSFKIRRGNGTYITTPSVRLVIIPGSIVRVFKSGEWRFGEFMGMTSTNGLFSVHCMDDSIIHVKQKHIWLQDFDLIANKNLDVIVNYKNRSVWFCAKIVAVRENGRFDIRYVEGDSLEENVEASLIRPLFFKGQNVEASFKGDLKRCVIDKQSRNKSFSYMVDLTDGTKIEVPVDKIRHAFTQPEIIKGSMINGNWLDVGNWYPGTVTRVRPNGTFDIVYDDGDEEFAVEHQNIVVRSARQERISSTTLEQKDGRELCRLAALLELSGHMTIQGEDGVSTSQKRHVSIAHHVSIAQRL